MPRASPIANLDVIGELEGAPQKVVGDYVESKEQNKFFVKPPNWDSTGDAIELLALKNENELHAMLKTQSDMRENAARQSLINKSHIEEINSMQDKLRQRFILANNFFKECDDKRRGADAIVKQEKQLHEELKEEIKTTKENVQVLIKFRKVLQKIVDDLEPYERVINDVVAQSDIWKTTKDCTDSCDALMLTQVELTEMKHQKIIEIEELRLHLVKLTTDAAATLLGLNNELSQLDRAYGVACYECLYWEKIFANVKSTIASADLYSERMQDEILLMYRIVCKRRGMDLLRLSMEDMLSCVRDEIFILQEVFNYCTTPKKMTFKPLLPRTS